MATDIGVDAVKIGMLGTAETIEAVASALDLLPGVPVVLDPVMVAESGATLLDPAARDALVRTLLPRATVVTPNLQEARVLSGLEGDDASAADAEALARAVRSLGAQVVVVTGGHGDDDQQATDLFFDGERVVTISGPRHAAGASHGSGMHALLGAGGPARARARAAGGSSGGEADRRRGGARRPARPRRRGGAGRRHRAAPHARRELNAPLT